MVSFLRLFNLPSCDEKGNKHKNTKIVISHVGCDADRRERRSGISRRKSGYNRR
jgi:hypothetical protein